MGPFSDSELESFDYSKLDTKTSDFLKQRVENMHSIAENTRYRMGRELAAAQEKLAHNYQGTFVKWFKSLGLNKNDVYFWINEYKFSKNLENSQQAINFGNASKMLKRDVMKKSTSEEARQAALNGDIKTHKEYKALEAKLKQREQELADRDETIANQQAELEDNRKTQLELNKRNAELSKQQPEPKVITKTVTKEVKPADYDQIKERLADLEKRAKKDQEDIEYYQRELQASENRRKQSESDDHLKELELKRKKRDAQIDAYSVSLKIADFLPELQKITQDDIDRMGDEAKHNLRTRIDMIRQIIDNIDAMFDGPRVIEGDFTNDN